MCSGAGVLGAVCPLAHKNQGSNPKPNYSLHPEAFGYVKRVGWGGGSKLVFPLASLYSNPKRAPSKRQTHLKLGETLFLGAR